MAHLSMYPETSSRSHICHRDVSQKLQYFFLLVTAGKKNKKTHFLSQTCYNSMIRDKSHITSLVTEG